MNDDLDTEQDDTIEGGGSADSHQRLNFSDGIREKFNFSNDMQDRILACLIVHPDKFADSFDLIRPKHFDGSVAHEVAWERQEYLKKYGKTPDFSMIGNLIYRRLAMRNPDRAKECVSYIKKLARLSTDDVEAVRDIVVAFVQERAIQNALRVAMDASYKGEEVKGGIVNLFENAVNVGKANNPMSLRDVLNHPEDDGSNLLGNRFLFRGGSLMLTGPTGVGKSALALQMAVAFALGLPAFGIKPEKPLRSLVVQAENDTGDLREMAMGVCSGFKLGPEQHGEVGANVHFITIADASGNEFLERLNALVRKSQPDLVWLDPLFSFLGESAVNQEAVSKFLRNGLNPIIQRHKCGLVIIHHQNKPSMTNTKREFQNHEWAYAAAGSAELSNWPRAIMSVQSSESDRLFRVILGKRGRRAGIADDSGKPVLSFLIKHHPGMIYWEVADKEDEDALESSNSGEDAVLALIPEKAPISLGVIKILARQKAKIGVNRTPGLLSNLIQKKTVFLWPKKGSQEKWYARFAMPADWQWE